MEKKPTAWKLIAADIDGTLLDDEKRLPALVRDTLRKAHQRGIRIALLSGRMPLAVELVEQELDIPCIKACSAGTCVILDSGEMRIHKIRPEAVQAVYEKVAVAYRIPLWIYQGRTWMVTQVDDYVRRESRIIRHEPELVSMGRCCERWAADETGPNKLLFGAHPEVIRALHRELEPFRSEGLDFAQSDTAYMEMFPRDVNKGSALELICREIGIRREETIAFGDQELDLPLLEAAGFAVAMGNAIPRLKETADYVTASNNQAGVALALQNLLGL